MKLKILDLNLWNYNNFEKRKLKIIRFIKKHNPEIVVMQEVRDDLQFNKPGNNQAKQLNEKLNYPHMIFQQITDKRKERPEKYNRACFEGAAVLSRFPIVSSEKETLKKQKGDRYFCGNLFFRIKAEKTVDLITLQFSPNSKFSHLQLIETLKQAKEKKIRPIIIGDFNIHEKGFLHNTIKGDYKSSSQFKSYLSYPKAGWTLDYILIPKDYTFKSFKCKGRGLSDHKALIAEIETN